VKKTGPERLSDLLRGLWALCAVACAVGATGYVMLNDAASAFAMAAGGVIFLLLSEYAKDR
jgi:hypothetical protein